ncbi:MAG: PD-(D/E)XK nuclease family transposase [Lachnospiraceae bacterium]|nr:PD-(D/E)XK nuclease family transposase [Lachnospiraceae bacterium]
MKVIFLSTTEQTHLLDLERVKLLRYMDDDFMTVCLADNFEGVELILRIILGQEDIKIKSVQTQESMKNLQGRSVVLDVHAVDSANKEFDVEIQRSDAGAGAKRARHNSSLLDAHILKPGDEPENISDSYVIFITENDVMKGNQAIYPVERYVTIGKEKVLFGDGSHILYVNGKYRGNDEIGKLMHDFSCTNPDDMNYEALAKKARYFKQDKEGVAAMCKMMEDMRNEAAREATQDKAKKTAIRLIKIGKMSLEEIAEATELSLDTVKELENQTMQLA